jgi:hypothetical protein
MTLTRDFNLSCAIFLAKGCAEAALKRSSIFNIGVYEALGAALRESIFLNFE